jgi:hypothetical protein
MSCIARRETLRAYLVEENQDVTTACQERRCVRRYDAYMSYDLSMVVQEGKPPKLQARWRGPFRVGMRFSRMSYRLVNVDGSPLRMVSVYDFRSHSLKPFRPRSGYLQLPNETPVPPNQLL